MIFIYEMYDKTNIKYALWYGRYGHDYKLNWENNIFLWTYYFEQLRIRLRSE